MGLAWAVPSSCSRFQRASMLVLIPRLVAVLVMPSVCASLSDPSPSGAAFGVKNGGKFVFGCVGFVFNHDCLHCEAVLVVYKILPISHRLIATMVGDFSSATEGQYDNRRRKLGIDPLVAALAEHLNVKGGEALEASEDYLKTVGFRKNRLRSYIIQAFGEQLAGALLENPRAKIITELVAHKDKLAGFTAPELDFAANSSTAIKLEVTGEVDDFANDADSAPWDEPADLVREDEMILELPDPAMVNSSLDLEAAAADN